MKKPLARYQCPSDLQEPRELEDLPIRLSADFIHNGAEDAAVALEELGGGKGSTRRSKTPVSWVFSSDSRPPPTECLAVMRRPQMMRRVSTGGHIGQLNDSAEGVLGEVSAGNRKERLCRKATDIIRDWR